MKGSIELMQYKTLNYLYPSDVACMPAKYFRRYILRYISAIANNIKRAVPKTTLISLSYAE